MKILLIIFTILVISFLPAKVFAIDCSDPANQQKVECIFGTITPPSPIAGFLGTDATGAGGISKFLSNLVALFYTLATIVLVLMILWGAFDWMTSEGDKEKVAAAQRKLINAFIGILLFAVAFAIIAVLGQFTGFTFFKGQNTKVIKSGNGYDVTCPDGFNYYYGGVGNPAGECDKHGG